MSYTLHNLTPRTEHSFPTFSRIQSSSNQNSPAEIYDHSRVAPWADLPTSLQVMSPTGLLRYRDNKTLHRRDGQFTEHEDFTCQTLVLPSVDHQHQTYDSAESIATRAPESDLDDEQLIALLASPLCLQEREANAERSQVYHSERENLMSSSSQDPTSTGKPVAVAFKPEQVQSRHVSSGHQTWSFWEQWTFHQDSGNPANVANSHFDGSRDLWFGWSEIWTHEAGIQRGISQHLHLWTFSSKLMLSDWNWRTPIHGYEESRRRASTATSRVGHERGRHFETLRTEVFTNWENWRDLKNYGSPNSLCKNWEKVMTRYRDSLNKHKSCKRGWIAWVIPEYFKRLESNYSGKFLTFPVNQAVIPSPPSLLSRDQTFATWYMEFVRTTGKRFFGNPRSYVRVITDASSRSSSLSRLQVLQVWIQCR